MKHTRPLLLRTQGRIMPALLNVKREEVAVREASSLLPREKVMPAERPSTKCCDMPMPAGLMSSEARSPPRAVKAPPMALTRAVVNE